MSGKCQGNLIFFQIQEMSGNFANCQGNLIFLVNVRELSGNFENSSPVNELTVSSFHQCFWCSHKPDRILKYIL